MTTLDPTVITAVTGLIVFATFGCFVILVRWNVDLSERIDALEAARGRSRAVVPLIVATGDLPPATPPPPPTYPDHFADWIARNEGRAA